LINLLFIELNVKLCSLEPDSWTIIQSIHIILEPDPWAIHFIIWVNVTDGDIVFVCHMRHRLVFTLEFFNLIIAQTSYLSSFWPFLVSTHCFHSFYPASGLIRIKCHKLDWVLGVRTSHWNESISSLFDRSSHFGWIHMIDFSFNYIKVYLICISLLYLECHTVFQFI